MHSWSDRREPSPNLTYEGPDRRFDDGTISPRDRFGLIERTQSEHARMLAAIDMKLNRLFGALALIGLAMPVLLFFLGRLFP